MYALYNNAPKHVKSVQAISPVLEKSPGSDNVSATQLSYEVCTKEVVGNVVGRILEEVKKNGKINGACSQKKMEEYESIILQMNKERLRLERQIAQLMKEQTTNKRILCGKAPMAATILKGELESKQKEFAELQGNCQQLEELLLEVPVLKEELQKSNQETKAVSNLLFRCRKSNAELKEHVANLNMQIKDVDMISEQQKELQKRIGEVTQERDENVAEVHRLCKLLEKKEEEVQRNRNHCVTLEQLVDRLENAAAEAEKYVALSKENETLLQYQIDELSLSLETKSQLLEDTQSNFVEVEDELEKSREKEKELKERCEKLGEQRDFLASDQDLHKMEISRQEHLINRQQQEITDLKVKLENTVEQMEYMQSQQQEVNEFTEEERKTLEVTVGEMESQLKQSNLKRTELDASLKNQSMKYEELVEEMELSRGLLRDKQEELDATQCQAHWIVLQQESIIAETAKELSEISDIVNECLWKCNGSDVDEVNKGKDVTQISKIECPCSEDDAFATPRSLVQSVLEATAMRENKKELPAASQADDLCVQLSPIYEESEGELSCSRLNLGDEEKPPSLIEQTLGLKQALKQLAEVVSNLAPSLHAQNTVRSLQEQRILLEKEHKSALEKVVSELNECRISERKLRQENSSKFNQIASLQQQLKESRENLQHAWQKLDSLGEQFENTFEQQNKISELSEEIKHFSEEVRKLKGENESLSQQLKESYAKLDELSQDSLGKVLEEKFNLQKKIQTMKEKSVEYRMETQDYLSEYKCRTESKIRVLEGNILKAEAEICRLDELVEKIRLVLHKYDDVIPSCPDLNKLLLFLDGHDTQ